MAVKLYSVELSAKEMQALVNAATGFYNRVNQEKRKVDMVMTTEITSAFLKFKKVLDEVEDSDTLQGAKTK